jgi:hypothetical protein
MLKWLKKSIQRLMAIVWVRRTYESAMRIALEILAINRITSFVYSVLSIPTFNREQFAVLRGRRDYYRNLTKARASRTELRRNIHRLEKGILMRPRRAVFALDYLTETIEFYERATAHHGSYAASDADELTWACGVLAEYFSVADRAHPVIAQAFARFSATQATFLPDDKQKVPYKRAKGATSTTTYEQLLTLAQQRRSIRWFEQRPAPRDLIDKALLVARQSRPGLTMSTTGFSSGISEMK